MALFFFRLIILRNDKTTVAVTTGHNKFNYLLVTYEIMSNVHIATRLCFLVSSTQNQTSYSASIHNGMSDAG